jgi:glutamyl-tRNA synthetase
VGNAGAEEELRKRWKPEAAPALADYITRLGGVATWNAATLDGLFNEVLKQHSMKVGQLMPLYRLFVAGRMQGPGMFEVSELLGREEVVARLQAGIDLCRTWA